MWHCKYLWFISIKDWDTKGIEKLDSVESSIKVIPFGGIKVEFDVESHWYERSFILLILES
jgi:hypothetical protein